VSIEKDPTAYPLITYAGVVLIAVWGGIVSFLRKYREGAVRPFNFTELIGELVASAFISIITFWLCEWSDVHPLLSAALIGINGHMGSRGLFQLEEWANARYTKFLEK